MLPKARPGKEELIELNCIKSRTCTLCKTLGKDKVWGRKYFQITGLTMDLYLVYIKASQISIIIKIKINDDNKTELR